MLAREGSLFAVAVVLIVLADFDISLWIFVQWRLGLPLW